MRIAFHILRMNWYRMLSSAIDQALKRGHYVECWHNAGASELGELCPDLKRIPQFNYGKAKIIEYTPSEEIIKLVLKNEVDVVVDIVPPKREWMKNWPIFPDRPYWVILDGPATSSILQFKIEDQLMSCDLFALKSPSHISDCSKMMTFDPSDLIRRVHKHHRHGWLWFKREIEDGVSFRWDYKHDQYFKERAIPVGQPQLDILAKLRLKPTSYVFKY